MSMLSAQCDELRSMAVSVGLAAPQAATLMMEAADTIWELRCKLADMVDMRERARVADGENAKLRELVKEMRVCLEDECKRCHEWGDACDLEHQMRELGIETGDGVS